jgi:hypothetical protein
VRSRQLPSGLKSGKHSADRPKNPPRCKAVLVQGSLLFISGFAFPV